jgi:tetratricopeptide (TPR) repeat protein
MAKRNNDKQRAKRNERKAKQRSDRRASTIKKGLAFEHRAARAIAQIKPDLDVSHNKRLVTEPGHRRQFDVVARLNGVLMHTYEARDHERKVDTGQIEAFETKNATLKDKPQLAGIVSAQGFWKKPIDWVHFYRDPEHDRKFVQELYQLRSSIPGDWRNAFQQTTVEVDGRSLRTLPVRILYGDTLPAGAGRDITLTSDRSNSFIHDEQGRLIGNLIDVVNREIRRAISSGDITPRVVDVPPNSFLTVGTCTRRVTGVEVAFEEISIPAVTTIDRSGQYPDTLIDALTGRQWLIEDREAALKASRSGYNLMLAFPGSDGKGFVDLAQLPSPPELEGPGIPAGLAARAAAVSLHAAIERMRANEKAEDIPPRLLDLVRTARQAMLDADVSTATRLYKESLEIGTALDALCSLGYLASKRGDHADALLYSFKAAALFPLEPQGFANLVAGFLALKDLASARRILECARLFHGVSFQVRRQEADLLYHEGRLREAAELFFELSLDDENDPALIANLARCEHAMGHHAAAAWDAHRATKMSPTNAPLAVLAAAYAEFAEQPDRVVEIATAFMRGEGPFDLQLARHAVNASLAARNAAAARGWLERVDRSRWEAIDFAVYGQLRIATESGDDAIDDLRRALNAPDVSDDVRIRVAEASLQIGRPSESLAACSNTNDRRAPRLRAIANAALGRADAALASIASLPPDDANRVVIECMQRCPNKIGGDLASLAKFTDWLCQRDSDDPRVIKRQAWLVAAKACGKRDTELGQQALRLIERVRGNDPNTLDVLPARVLALVATNLIAEAEAALRAGPLTNPADVLAVSALVAMEGVAPLIAFLFAEAAARTGIPPVNYPPDQLKTVHLLSALSSRQDIDVIRRVAGTGDFSKDPAGILAGALLHYVDGKLDDCVRKLSPLIGANGTMFEAFRLRSQCLAEQGAFAELVAVAQKHMPSIVHLVEWAAQRSDGPFEPGLLPAVAAQFALMETPDFAGVARSGNLCMSYPVADWVGALDLAFRNCPTAEVIWVVRPGHPAGYLQSLLTQRPLVGGP